MVIFGEGTQIVLLVERNMFQRNVGELGAGALLNTYISNSLPGAPHMTNITDCSFHENSGESGGAVLNYLSYQGTHVGSKEVLCSYSVRIFIFIVF